MAIRKITGNILQDNLQRGANLSIQGNLVYFDVTNNRVGVLTDSPEDEFEIIGVANATDVRITSATANALLFANENLLVKSSSNLTFDGTTLTVDSVSSGTANIGNISIVDTTISSTLPNSTITLSPDGNSEVVIDTTSGIVLPVGSTAERPSVPTVGTVRYNSNLNIVEVFNGVDWEGVGEDLSTISQQLIVGDDSTVSFALDQETTSVAIIVSINGVVQSPEVAYTVSGATITFAEAPLTSDVVDVRFIAELSIVKAISNTTGANVISVDDTGVANLTTVQSVHLPSYTASAIASLPNVADGQLAYCTNGDAGSPCLAVYSQGNWRIVSLGAIITP